MNLSAALVAVDENANAQWKSTADLIIYNLARTRRVFTSDDVWEGLMLVGMHTHENRAMGPRITNAIKNGIIEISSCDHCGTKKVMTASRREEAHQMDIPVYNSLIYGIL